MSESTDQRDRCHLCNGRGPLVDVRVETNPSITALCWTCVTGLARCREVQVATTAVIKITKEDAERAERRRCRR